MGTASSALALARELLARESVTPADGGCLDILAARLAPLGFQCERMDAGDTANLWAQRGNARPLVCFAGHVDVVPPGPLDAWRFAPFSPTEADGKLYARGAADMKSSIACFIVAVETLLAANPTLPGSIALLLTSDEEGAATHGTTHVVETLRARGQRLDCCIVGEPTCENTLGDTIKNGRRGSLSATLRVIGTQGHVAYPHLASNPIHLAAPALVELTTERWDEGDAYFPPTTFQVSNIHAGTGAPNVIPGACEIRFNFRFAACTSVETLQQRTRAILDAHGLDYQLDWELSGQPFFTPPGRILDAIREAIERHAHIRPQLSTSGGTSDGRFIATLCDEVIEFGPLNRTIHKVNEHIDLAHIDTLTAIYHDTRARLLAP